MKPVQITLIVTSAFLAGAPLVRAQQEPDAIAAPEKPVAPKAKAFEISHGNLFEALRQMAAYKKLDLVIDPDVPNRKGLYAFKYTTWENALETLLASHSLGGEIKNGILHVGFASRFPNATSRSMTGGPERNHATRTISITFRPSPEGEGLLSVSASGATKAEILDALSKIERLAKAKPGKQSFNANWVLRPMKEGSRDDLESFSMEDVTPAGLRALYP
jgi:hypothetical protein